MACPECDEGAASGPQALDGLVDSAFLVTILPGRLERYSQKGDA